MTWPNAFAEVHRTMQERIEEATAQLAFQARHDPLTGLVNRREFETRLENPSPPPRPEAGTAALLYIDLDRFQAGQRHLRPPACRRRASTTDLRLFQGRLRGGHLARIGGDEFGVLLNNCSSSPRALQVAEDFCAMAAAYRFISGMRSFTIGASIGLASITRLTRSVAEALTTSDAACYSPRSKDAIGSIRILPARLATVAIPTSPGKERIRTALADDVPRLRSPSRCGAWVASASPSP